MRKRILACTRRALSGVCSPRFFKSERGFVGRFYCALLNEMEDCGLIDDARTLEMEYQKGFPTHGTNQRPDIIYHIPTEITGADVKDYNFAVWAFKLSGNEMRAVKDFEKLDIMFDNLHYETGIFVNINSTSDWLEEYHGRFRDRLFGISVWREGQEIKHQMRGGAETGT